MGTRRGLPTGTSLDRGSSFGFWLAILALSIVAGSRTASAQAGEPVVCLVGPVAGAPRVLDEARVRIQAELKAAGFEILGGDGSVRDGNEPGRWECPAGSATITLELVGQSLTIWSQVSGAHEPLSQTLSLQSGDATAELIAIRAVDGLRAAVLEALVTNQSVVSRPLAEFASARPPREAAREETPPVTEPTSVAVPAEPKRAKVSSESSQKKEKQFGGMVAFGPELVGGVGAPGVSLGASIDLWWRFFAIGLAADVALLGASWEAEGARIAIREYGLGLRSQIAPCKRPLLCQFGAGLSVRTVALDAVQSLAGSELLERGAHTSPAVDIGLGFGYWLSGSVGVQASAWGHVYTDAPRLVVGAEESVWGRPSYVVAIGPFFWL